MTPFIKRNFLIPVSVILFVGILYGLDSFVPSLKNSVQHLEIVAISFLILMSVTVMLFWGLLGVFGGLASFLVAMIFLYAPLTDLNPYYYGVLIVAFFLSCFIGYHINRKIGSANQEYTVSMEKIEEDTNLINNHIQNRRAEVLAMGEKIGSLLKLKNIADSLSLSLSEDDITRIVSEETFAIFGPKSRVLMFKTDEAAHGGLNLISTLKGDDRKPFLMKNGGIFDKWAYKNMKSLLVKDVRKDFRFSVSAEEKADDTVSLMIKPVLTENNITALIRVDSMNESMFGQYELRLLDIIGELTAVALENSRLYRQTEELAIKDSLTGLYVHRYFMERLESEVQRALRSNISFALLMIDIDNFKEFNDRYGHIAGDSVLRNIGRILSSKASAGDIVARYGGEEFAFLALNVTKTEAVELADNIRKEVQGTPIVMRREEHAVTVSIGVASFPEDARLREDIIWEADRCLYKAKARKGKNATCSK